MDTAAPMPLEQVLLSRLRPLMGPRMAGTHSHDRPSSDWQLFKDWQLFNYCCLDRERLLAAVMPHPLIGIVLRGAKEVWLGDTGHSYRAGQAFVLPGGVALDLVNIPDARSGMYEALVLEVTRLPAGLKPTAAAPAPAGFDLPLTPDLVESLVHAATTIADRQASDALKTLRLSEVLTLLQPVAAARPLFRRSLPDEVAWLIGAAPSQPWTVEAVASQLGMGASTLRRRLGDSGHSFRHILRDERLKAARAVLQNGASSFQAAEAAGYVSRSHFARRFRETFGATPKATQPA